MIIEKYGRDFWDKFKSGSDKLFRVMWRGIRPCGSFR